MRSQMRSQNSKSERTQVEIQSPYAEIHGIPVFLYRLTTQIDYSHEMINRPYMYISS